MDGRVGRWEFDDWHHPKCSGDDYCDKWFCRDHRRIYWTCQDAHEEKSVGYFGGDGECLLCKSEARSRKALLEMGLHTGL